MFINPVYPADKSQDHIPVTLSVNVDKDTVYIGDKLRYTIEVRADKSFQVKVPEFGENLENFSIRDFGSSTGGWFGKKTTTHWYILDTYETGEFTLPPVTIQYKGKGDSQWHEITSNKVTIRVKSVLDSQKDLKLRDIKGPVAPGNPAIFYAGIFAIILIIIITTIIILVRRRQVIKNVPSTPPPPAHEVAYEALKRLQSKDYLQTGQVKLYYSELSDIIRHYLENRFSLRAPEMTTEEFLSGLRDTDVLKPEHKSLLRDFLSHCDMVKFAKYNPAEKEISESYESARKLIDQTREHV